MTVLNTIKRYFRNLLTKAPDLNDEDVRSKKRNVVKHQVILDPDGTEDNFLAVIVPFETGIVYENQVGGFLNELRMMERFLIPIVFKTLADEIYTWFENECHGNAYLTEWTQDRLDRLDKLLGNIPCWQTDSSKSTDRVMLRLDRSQLAALTEAWIPVISPYGEAILASKNSD